ncbi:MAG: ribosome biogenesis GTPase YqeH [Gorillibacterium sp.]|nr:ribosome biogenesis GTPase YqeH [Gorillibacterium sp.]
MNRDLDTTRLGSNDEDLHCEGCGVQLQRSDSGKIGYVPESALTRCPIVCQRCFRIKHYNEVSSATLNQDDFLKMLGGIEATNSLVVHIVDLFDFEGSLIAGLQRFVGNNPILLAVNKIDLLPKVTNYNRIFNWVQQRTKEMGLKTVDIVLCSAKKNMGFDVLLHKIDQYRQGRDIYVVGATNVGKSTLINRLIHDYSDLESELTTSPYPGTTLDLVKIPLEDGRDIVDTPGIVYKHRMTELVDKKELATIMPAATLKPMVFQLNDNQTLFFGALARMDYIKGERRSFTCYMAGALQIHRTKLERADELYNDHKGTMLQPPGANSSVELPVLVKHPVHIPKDQKTDVLISGLGWITVNGTTGAELVVWAPKGVMLAVRPSLI